MGAKKIFFAVILSVTVICSLFPDPGNRKSGNILRNGVAVHDSVKIITDTTSFSSFKINVPGYAYGIRISLEDAMEDLDLFAVFGHEVNDYNKVDAVSETDSGSEELIITRLSDPPLSSGEYYIDVAYRLNNPPVIGGKPANEIPFTIRYDIIEFPQKPILTDKEYDFLLSPKRGMIERFAIEVPQDADCLRVDVIESDGDVDFLLGRNTPMLTKKNSEYIKTTYLSREHIVITRPELISGSYYLTVFEQKETPYPVNCTIRISFSGDDPPEELFVFPEHENAIRQAMTEVVEVISDYSRGSGCIVSSDGYILTNYHVIKRIDGSANTKIWIAVNEDPHKPAREMFTADLIDYHTAYDLALFKINSSFYSRELPENYRFPFLEIGDDTSLYPGDRLNIIGYPGVGGTGARVTISLTSGIVSGFEQLGDGFVIKTDSVINYGNSGGAALDQSFRLIGLPTVIIGEGTSQMGFIHPINLIPASWKKIIGLEN